MSLVISVTGCSGSDNAPPASQLACLLQSRLHHLLQSSPFNHLATTTCKTMAVATQLGLCTSSFFCPSPVAASKPAASPLQCSSSTTTLNVVCHSENQTSRRAIAVAAAGFAISAGAFLQPQAAEAKRNKPAPPEEKKAAEAVEDKSLSAYDARLLATAKRKEAMKATVDKLKAKATSE